MRIKICWAGKTQNAPIRTLLADYLGRLRHMAVIEIVETPDRARRQGLRGEALLAAEAADFDRSLSEAARVVALDAEGRQLSSREFARWLASQQVQGTRELAFVIGGPEGIARSLADKAELRLSLGKMTWTHEMARVLLLEQIYRALCIARNIPYHK